MGDGLGLGDGPGLGDGDGLGFDVGSPGRKQLGSLFGTATESEGGEPIDRVPVKHNTTLSPSLTFGPALVPKSAQSAWYCAGSPL